MILYLGQTVQVTDNNKTKPGIYIGEDDKGMWVFTTYTDKAMTKTKKNYDAFTFEKRNISKYSDGARQYLGGLKTHHINGVLEDDKLDESIMIAELIKTKKNKKLIPF